MEYTRRRGAGVEGVAPGGVIPERERRAGDCAPRARDREREAGREAGSSGSADSSKQALMTEQ
jgi:hypothetical protein